MAQITNNLMKKRLLQVIFLDCPTFKLRSSNRSLEIFDSDHQGYLKLKFLLNFIGYMCTFCHFGLMSTY